jgi:hypothetical protein
LEAGGIGEILYFVAKNVVFLSALCRKVPELPSGP